MLAKELQRGSDRLAGKKVVIWEFAARELACGDWKPVPLVLGREEGGRVSIVPDAGRTVEVRGVVRGSFRRAAARHRAVQGSHSHDRIWPTSRSPMIPRPTGKEAVVLAWSMRDNKAMPAVRYRPGDMVRLPAALV